MDFLNSKERKEFFQSLAEEYGYQGPTDYAIYEGGKDKLYFISRGLDKLPFEELRIRQGGLHVATRMHAEHRLTMDGAQLLGPHCTHEPVILDDAQRDAWMRGEDIPVADERQAFVIVRWRDDILGCARLTGGKLKNYVPKERRISDPHP